jgi:hypothetical protein
MRRTQNRSRPLAAAKATPRILKDGAVPTNFQHPPPIIPQIEYNTRLRFTCTTAGSQLVTFQNLLDAILISTTATQGYQLFDSVKIKFVEMWDSASSSTPTTVECSFPAGAGFGGSGMVFQDTAIGGGIAHVKAKPAKMSANALYQSSSTNIAFELVQVSVGCIIDVSVICRNNASTPIACQNALVAAVVGDIYFRGLDGLAAAATKFPSSLNPTV